MIKKKFKITGMHCTSCALTIDMDLEDVAGVKNSSTNYAKSISEVEFDPQEVSDTVIIETIRKTGYTAFPLDS